MTVPFSNELYLAVTPGGAVFLQATFETWVASGQLQPVDNVQLTVAPASGGGPVLTTSAATTPDNCTWTFQWLPPASTAPGDYTVTWTGVTPASATLTIAYNLTVVSPPQESPTPGVYATVAQYQAWSSDQITPSATVTTWLRRASEVLDLALIAAVYATDPDGMPTEPSTIDVFMRACCAQAEYMIANNDRANVKWMYQSTNVGGVALARASGTTGGAMPKLAPQAAAILRLAGVLGAAPLNAW